MPLFRRTENAKKSPSTRSFACEGPVPGGAPVLVRGDLLQLFGLDYLAVETGFPAVLAAGDAHQGGVVHARHLEVGLVLLVDVVLVDLDVHLADRAGRDDHVGAAIIGRLDDVLDQRLAGVAQTALTFSSDKRTMTRYRPGERRQAGQVRAHDPQPQGQRPGGGCEHALAGARGEADRVGGEAGGGVPVEYCGGVNR